MSVFFTDSNCELWHDIVDKLKIEYISMPFTITGKEQFYDLGKTFDFDNFYKLIRSGEMPITSALSPQNYVDIFEPVLKNGEDILYVHFSSALSGTFEFMKQAINELKEKYPERTIKTVDTSNISLGGGLIAYEAALLHRKGTPDDEIIDFVNNFKKEVAVYFTVDDLNHLKRGGRISAATAFFGSVLGIKPILSVNEDGKLVSIAKEKGRKRAIQYLFNKLVQEGKNVADYPISIIHADCEKDALELKNKILEVVGPDATIWFQPIGPTVGTHCGPGTLGLVFHKK